MTSGSDHASVQQNMRKGIAALTGPNWHLWSARVRTTLRSHDAWHPVEDETAVAEDATAKEKREWRLADAKAYDLIFFTCSDSIQTDLLGLDSEDKSAPAAVIWAYLKSTYRSKSVEARLLVKGQILDCLSSPKATMTEHISELGGLYDQLGQIGKKPDEEERCIELLWSLPSAFRSFKWSVTNVTSWAELKSRILEAERSIQREEEKDAKDKATKDAAFAAFSRQQQSNGNESRDTDKGTPAQQRGDHRRNNGRFDGKCMICQKHGHRMFDCRYIDTARNAVENKMSGEGRQQDRAAMAHESAPARYTTTPVNVDFSCAVGAADNAAGLFMIDTGSTRHIVPDASVLTKYRAAPSGTAIECANGGMMAVSGYGDLIAKTEDGIKIEFKDVAHCPSSVGNLIGGKRLTAAGFGIHFDNDTVIVAAKDTGAVVMKARSVGNNWLVPLEMTKTDNTFAAKDAPDPECMYWHRCAGHANERLLHLMAASGTVVGMPKKLGPLGFCSDCAEGKMARSKHPRIDIGEREQRPMKRLHADIFGPVRLSSGEALDGGRFGLVITDEATHHIWVVVLRNKSQAVESLIAFHAQALTKYPDKLISSIRTDNAAEFKSAVLLSYWRKHGIKHEASPRYAPQSNGVAERAVRTVTEMCRTLLIAANLPAFFWPAAVRASAHIKNRVPATGLRKGETPFEALHGQPAKQERLRIFGCVAWAKLPEVERNGKFGTKARPYVYLGPAFSNAHRLWDPVAQKECIEHSVVFDERGSAAEVLEKEERHRENANTGEGRILDMNECGDDAEEAPILARPTAASNAVPMTDQAPPPAPTPQPATANSEQRAALRVILEGGVAPEGAREVMGQMVRGERVAPEEAQRASELLMALSQQLQTQQTGSMELAGEARENERGQTGDQELQRIERRSARLAGRPPDNLALPDTSRKRKWPDGAYAADACYAVLEPAEVPYGDPRTVAEARARPDREDWRKAMEKELGSHKERETWRAVVPPPDANLVSGKWVFRIKRNANGTIQKYKARLVARGFTQVQGVDFDETFAPTSRLQHLRLFCALVAALDMELHQIDFETAYLNALLKHKIYMIPPEGVDVAEGEVLELRLALYGLKQSAHDWYGVLAAALKTLGYVQADFDPTIFVRTTGEPAMLLVYVDDILVAAPRSSDIEKVKKELLGLFRGTDLGPAHHCLGIRIERDRAAGSVALDQERYAEEVLDRFGMSECKATRTPMETKASLRKAVDGEARADKGRYQAIVGSLAYLAQGTRPDLAFSVSVLGRFCADPSEVHMVAAKRVLRYLRGTAGSKLRFGGSDEVELSGYVDADWAADKDDRRSVSGFVFTVNGGAVAWGSKKQGAVALSTAEAEYMAAGAAGREAIMLRGALLAAGQQVGAMVVHCDNQAALMLVKNPGSHHDRSKHIDIIHHWIRDQTQQGAFAFKYIPTDLNPADAFTKPLGVIKHTEHAGRIGMDLRRNDGEKGNSDGGTGE